MLFMGELKKDNIDAIADNIIFVMKAIAAVEVVGDCITEKRPYDKDVKAAAQHAINDGCDIIWVQCFANGNLEMADDVLAEAKTHYDIWAKENNIKNDNS